MNPTLAIIEKLARHAGKMAVEMRKEDLDVQQKGYADLVTRADKEIEAYLLGEIERHFPEHTVLGEESGMHQQGSQHRWFVDPIDGTLNYAHGLPEYSISIGYALGDEIQIGVVYCPEMD